MIQNEDDLQKVKQLMVTASVLGKDEWFENLYAMVCEYEERGIEV